MAKLAPADDRAWAATALFIVEHIREVCWVVDPAGTELSYVNPAFEETWGRSRDSLYANPLSFLDLIHPDDQAQVWEAFNRMASYGPFDATYRVVREDGSIRWMNAHSEVIGTGDGARRVGLAQDITAHKENEELLHQERARLESALQETEESVRRYERERASIESLLSNATLAAEIAHEINNPLAGIRNGMTLLRKAVPADHPYFGYIDKIDAEIARVSRIIHGLTGLYRPQEERPERFLALDVIGEVIDLLAAQAKEADVAFDLSGVPADLTVLLPRALVKQALLNLVLNAVEASHPGGTVDLSVTADSDHIRFIVADHGAGISDEVRAQIFKPLFTTKRSGDGHGGLGYGLHVTRSLAEAMGGNVTFFSTLGSGSTFCLELPNALARPSESGAPRDAYCRETER